MISYYSISRNHIWSVIALKNASQCFIICKSSHEMFLLLLGRFLINIKTSWIQYVNDLPKVKVDSNGISLDVKWNVHFKNLEKSNLFVFLWNHKWTCEDDMYWLHGLLYIYTYELGSIAVHWHLNNPLQVALEAFMTPSAFRGWPHWISLKIVWQTWLSYWNTNHIWAPTFGCKAVKVYLISS